MVDFCLIIKATNKERTAERWRWKIMKRMNTIELINSVERFNKLMTSFLTLNNPRFFNNDVVKSVEQLLSKEYNVIRFFLTDDNSTVKKIDDFFFDYEQLTYVNCLLVTNLYLNGRCLKWDYETQCFTFNK